MTQQRKRRSPNSKVPSLGDVPLPLTKRVRWKSAPAGVAVAIAEAVAAVATEAAAVVATSAATAGKYRRKAKSLKLKKEAEMPPFFYRMCHCEELFFSEGKENNEAIP